MPDVQNFTRATVSSPSVTGEQVRALAQAASRTGAQDEFLLAPDKSVERFMDDFVAPVQEWCRTHADKVGACYLSVFEDAPAVFVIGRSAGYDFSLSQPLADLEMALHRRGWSCNVLQLPPDSPHLWAAFLDPVRALRVCPETLSGADHAHG